MPLYVTDTHPLFWYATKSYAKLSKKALRIFDEAERQRALIYVPALALWELSRLLQSARAPRWEPFEWWAGRLLAQGGFDFVPFDLQVIAIATGLIFTKDPFDVAIVATAKLKELPLITKDREIVAAGIVEIAW